MKCIFCGRPAKDRWALTVKSLTGEWRRVIEPVCPRCHRLLPPSGQVGLRLRATGERWYAGHRVGRFPSPQPRTWNDPPNDETR